jgi:hypothetical protein
MLVESETAAAAGETDVTVAASGVGAVVTEAGAAESAGVVWAVAGSAVNNKTSAKTVLLERLARVLRGLSIFLLLKVGRCKKRYRFIKKDYRPLCVPICPVKLTVRHDIR